MQKKSKDKMQQGPDINYIQRNRFPQNSFKKWITDPLYHTCLMLADLYQTLASPF
jgi:hypothetical protein